MTASGFKIMEIISNTRSYCRKLSAASGDHLPFRSKVLVIARSKIKWPLWSNVMKLLKTYSTDRPRKAKRTEKDNVVKSFLTHNFV